MPEEVSDVLQEALKDAQEPTSLDVLAEIGEIAKRQLAAEALIESLEEQLEKAKKDLLEISDKELPAAMQKANCSDFTTTDGYRVKLTPMYFPSILKDDRPAVYDELSRMGHSGIIDTNLIIKIGKGGHDDANVLKALLTPFLNRYEAELDEDIHWATFRAFAKEQIEAGEDLPVKIKVHQVSRAVIKPPKKTR